MPPRKKSSARKKRAVCKQSMVPSISLLPATKHRPHYGIVLVAIIILALLGSVPLFAWSLDTVYNDKVLPGVVIGESASVGGLTRKEVENILDNYKEYLQEHGIVFETPEGERKILPSALSLNPDIPLDQLPPFIEIDSKKTFERAYAAGRSGSIAEQILGRVALFFDKTYIWPIFTLDKNALRSTLEKEFAYFQTEYRNAGFTLNKETQDLEVIAGQKGYGVDIDAAIEEVTYQIRNLQYPRITVQFVSLDPTITESDALFVKDQIYSMIQKPLTVAAKEKTFEITKEDMLEWVSIEKIQGSLPRAFADKEKLADYLKNTVAPVVEIPAKDAKYEMRDGKIITFQAPQDGKELDIEENVKKIITALLDTSAARSIELRIKEKKALTPTIEGSELIIKDILGKAETSFAGSPPNRRHNISIGANKINGVIVKNGESFSLLQTLGEINAKNGFKPELVIKGTKTTPEYGGGLCQISTTLFRAVAYSGLPILERQNHSYRVGYYEPPVGFDATIYSPKPDFRFLNDTGYPILLQASVEGTKVKMELWGVSDGRKVEVDTPTVFNIRKAGSTKIIETTDLPPGKKKCTERAHNGAEAVFERRVTYPDGELKKDVFKSRYVVWPAVCLIGKAPLPTPAKEQPLAIPSPQPIEPIDTVQIEASSSGSSTEN